jgi:hypothetical protein
MAAKDGKISWVVVNRAALAPGREAAQTGLVGIGKEGMVRL